MTSTYFLYPHQCFYQPYPKDALIVLIEDPLFFYDPITDLPFHQIKLTLHRASMKAFAQHLLDTGHRVTYIEYTEALKKEFYAEYTDHTVTVFDLVDDYAHRRLKAQAHTHHITLNWQPSPNFITDQETLETFFKDRRFFMRDFYQFQRQRLNILMEGASPLGGQYSFDTQNRQKLPPDEPVPAFYQAPSSPILEEAIAYVQTHFKIGRAHV
jgi:deoxyribodipyrimidine photolyase-related protein